MENLRAEKSAIRGYFYKSVFGPSVFILAISFAHPACCGGKQYPLVSIGGYYKNLFSVTESTTTNRLVYSDTQRLRLEWKMEYNDSIQTKVAFDKELVLGDYVRDPGFEAVRNMDQNKLTWLDGDRAYYDDEHVYAKYSLYRAYIKFYDPRFQLIVGKQRIDWGRCRFWSPMDLFNPISPLNIERDETVGVDAVDATIFFNSKTNLNFVYAPDDEFEDMSFGMRFFTRIYDYDMFVMAGEFKKDEVIGACVDGYLGQAGVRGEITYTWADDGKDFIRTCIGLEYTFKGRATVLAEYFYNGGAEDNEVDRFTADYAFSSRVLSMKKHLFGLSLEYEITPLFDFNCYGIMDFEGESFYINPEFKYNLLTNMDLCAGWQFYGGDDDGEFSPYKGLYYMYGQYFF